jgi:isopropylmalate/homocitrate/citramalate synthase
MNNKQPINPYNNLPEVNKQVSLPDNIKIYDSTLRDGEQMPYVSFTPHQKFTIAQKLEDIGIPEIEAGFPAISETEQRTIKQIVSNKNRAKILVLSRLKQEDIDAARQTDADLILLFIATSSLHLTNKLHLNQEQIKQRLINCLTYAHDHGINPSFSTEDSTRTPLPFLIDLYKLAETIGVQRIGITDTIGCATPQTIRYLFTQIRHHTKSPLSAHLHNDFGLALANALTSLQAGATHVCTTINGWGERAGNVPLEQLIMALTYLYNKDLNIDTTQLRPLADLIAIYTGNPLPKQTPIIGDNAFTHESGIHVAAVLENPQTYESIPPEIVGNQRKLVLGKHTGRHQIKHLLQTQGISPDPQLIDILTLEIKKLGETQHHITTTDVEHLIQTIRTNAP